MKITNQRYEDYKLEICRLQIRDMKITNQRYEDYKSEI